MPVDKGVPGMSYPLPKVHTRDILEADDPTLIDLQRKHFKDKAAKLESDVAELIEAVEHFLKWRGSEVNEHDAANRMFEALSALKAKEKQQ